MSEEKNAVVATEPKKTAVAKKSSSKTVISMLADERTKENIAKVLPSGMDIAKFMVVAQSQLAKNKGLVNCTTASFYDCLMKSARIGVLPDGRNAYLIPYGDQCTLQFDYKGLVDIVLRNGVAKRVYADVVCANDEFEYNLGVVENHRIKLGNRGNVIGAYAIAFLPNGEKQCEVMDKEEIDKIRSKSKNSNGVWKEWYNEMAKKCVFKRLTKWLKLTPDVVDAINADNEEIDLGKVDDAIEVDSITPHAGVKKSIAALTPPPKDETIDVTPKVEEKVEEPLPFE